ncbi:MAG: hypothetical protein JST04_14090 [Bdellovibrionales bacterium]|nr:hypothetical protein [Bdellovibrionales bacterium]
MKELIPILVFTPALGALLQTLNPRPAISRTLAIVASLVSAVAAIALFVQMDPGLETPKYVVAWMRSYSIHFALGVDGLNLLPMLVTAFVFPFLLISEWDRQFGRRGIHALLLLLETGILGALCAGDLFLLLFFLMLTPIPLYFLASIWGDEGRETSAFRMVSVSLVASACLFFGILLIYHAVDPHTFLIEDLAGKLAGKTTEIFGISVELQHIAFPLIVFGLALRAPFWPLQGWFRKFILKVPTTVAVGALLAGFPVALTVFTRIGFVLFPETMKAHLDVWIGIGIANLVFGALTLLQESDLRGILVSLSSVFAGFSLLGIGTAHPTGLVGSQFILFSSMVALAVWGFASEILRYRTRTYAIAEIQGVLRTLPDLGSATLLSIACAVGIPGTAGFISFALLYMGAFNYHPGVVLAALVVSLVVTGFLIQVYRRIFLGEKVQERFTRLGFRERLLLIPLAGVAICVGFFPSPFVEIVRATITKVLA